jgi:hypothetical protein
MKSGTWGYSVSMSFSYSWIPASIVAALLISGGCSPVKEDEPAVQEGRNSEVEQREALRQALDGGAEAGVAIKLVQSAPAAQGAGTMEQWLHRLTATNGSSIFFPRWEADRRGMGKYEVLFSCTLMKEDGRVGKWGVVWFVDIVLKTVAPPRQLEQDELNERSSRYLRDRRRGTPPEQLNLD